MNPWIGWALAALFVALAWQQYGWQGVLFAFTVVVFWLLLQFSRTLRVMRGTAQRPVGHVDSAVMLHAKLKPGLTMLQVVALTRSLGRRLGEGDDDWAWTDDGGSTVRLHFVNGKLAGFELDRPAP
ncbi:MAG: hypothetical protein AB7U92_19140 [Piscinibacter sp.]|uniref:hypothetical protein n=1 Tax=Piscinibacter sp. TaxID=1903157 RepID=UPI003D0DA868